MLYILFLIFFSYYFIQHLNSATAPIYIIIIYIFSPFYFNNLLFIILYWFFFSIPSLSLSLSLPIGNLSFSKIWWWFYDIKFALLVFYSNLVFLNWHLFYIPFFLWCIRCENECFPSITPLYKDNSIYWI